MFIRWDIGYIPEKCFSEIWPSAFTTVDTACAVWAAMKMRIYVVLFS